MSGLKTHGEGYTCTTGSHTRFSFLSRVSDKRLDLVMSVFDNLEQTPELHSSSVNVIGRKGAFLSEVNQNNCQER
jgi:hypothetical protein